MTVEDDDFGQSPDTNPPYVDDEEETHADYHYKEDSFYFDENRDKNSSYNVRSASSSSNCKSISQDNESRLFSLFEKFCKFGAPKEVHSSSYNSHTKLKDHPLMDGSRFVKLFKDANLIDKHPSGLTTTHLDIVFNKVKTINERKIAFSQFKEALGLIATKKFPDVSHGLAAVSALVEILLACPGPSFASVTVLISYKEIHNKHP